MRDSIIKKWEREMEFEDLVLLDYIISGLPEGYYKNRDNLSDALAYAIEEFCKRYHYSQKTMDEMVNVISVRDAFYKRLEKEGLL